MDPDPKDDHLSRLSTIWSGVSRAHGSDPDAAGQARRNLVVRYQRAVYLYLHKLVRDPDAALDLCQDFASRLMEGRFQGADPMRGRFRDYVKTSVINLVRDYYDRQRKCPQPLGSDLPGPAVESTAPPDPDEDFLPVWKPELVEHAWDELAQFEKQSGRPLHTMLRYKVDHPQAKSAEIAEHFSAVLGRPLVADWVDKRVYEAREKFRDLLVEEVAYSLGLPSYEELEAELIQFGWLDECRSALKRWCDRR